MRKIYTLGSVLVLLGLLLWGGAPLRAAESQRFQTRAKVWDVYWNNGVQGVSDAPDAWLSYYRQVGMQYPGVFIIQYETEFSQYWGERNWGTVNGAYAALYESTAIMPGFDTFVATRVPGDSNGEYHVSSSKPRRISDDIKQMSYDPSKGPEANIGYQKVSPLGPVMTNWWPGQTPPTKDQVVEIHNYRYFKYMDPDKDMFPESILVTRYTTKRGITVTKKAYGWSYPDYDDFEILEYEFENTGDSDGDGKPDLNGGQGLVLNDTFFAFAVRFFISQAGHAWTNYDAWYRVTQLSDLDDWFKYTEAPNYDGPASGKGLKMWYAYDGDNPNVPVLKMGKPFSPASERSGYRPYTGGLRKEGELTAFQYGGLAPIAYLPSNANDPATFSYDAKGNSRYVAPKVTDQPYAVKWWNFRNQTDYDEPDQNNHSFAQMYSLLAGAAPSIQPNPTNVGGMHGSFAYGPYDLKLGDKVRIVLALVAAAPVEENIWGWAKQGIQADMKTNKAFNNLVKHLKSARDAFKWGYDLPDPPPDVKVDVSVTPQANNLLTWEATADDATDPDYSGGEAKDVKGYRVYQSEFKRDDWQLIADVPVKDPKYYQDGKYSFVDPKSVAGFLYTYSVRAYDRGHGDWNGMGTAIPSLEGGANSPEQWAKGVDVAIPYVPSTAASDRLQQKVMVVPNPYREDGSHAYQSKGAIRFLNIPRKCRISIYTVAGDLMAQINHDNPTRGESTWTQTTIDNIGNASSGAYFFVVESQVPETLGQIQRGMFMIIK
jgi:hypothetical protein